MTDYGRPWTRGTVHQLLTNEKYVGNNVWNRRSFKLKKKYVANSPDIWVRATAAFDPIVTSEEFFQVRAVIEQRAARLSDEQMLEVLQQVLDTNGRLSGMIIDEFETAPSSNSYRRRFGSLRRAYALIGYSSERDERHIEINRALRALHPEIVSRISDGIHARGGSARLLPESEVMLINDEVYAGVSIARCRKTSSGSLRWIIHFERRTALDLTIVVRMDGANELPRDYYLLPRLDFIETKLRLSENNGIWFDAYRVDELEPLFELATRNRASELAA
jgi:hypothetical protein